MSGTGLRCWVVLDHGDRLTWTIGEDAGIGLALGAVGTPWLSASGPLPAAGPVGASQGDEEGVRTVLIRNAG